MKGNSTELERQEEMMSQYPGRKIHAAWFAYKSWWHKDIRAKNKKSWELLPVWTIRTYLRSGRKSTVVSIMEVKTWTMFMDEIRDKFQSSQWAKITKEKMEQAVMLEVRRIQAEITKVTSFDFSTVADFTTVQLTDLDMEWIVMVKLKGQERRTWPEFLHWKARQILS